MLRRIDGMPVTGRLICRGREHSRAAERGRIADPILRQRLAELIDEVAADRMPANEAMDEVARWEAAVWTDSDFVDAHHALLHYREDEDIRGRDEDYKKTPQRWLSSFAKRLRDGTGRHV